MLPALFGGELVGQLAGFGGQMAAGGFFRVNEAGSEELASSGRVSVEFCRVLASCACTRHFTDSFTDSGRSDLSNSLLLMQQNLEAEVGIGQFTPLLHPKYTWFHWLLNIIRLNPA
jgi:hypothetical protein